MMVKQADRGQPVLDHLGQVRPHVGECLIHAGKDRLAVRQAFEVTVDPPDDLVPDQQVRHLLRAAKARLHQVAPAPAGLPDAASSPVASEDRFPLAGDELVPPEGIDILIVMVVQGATIAIARQPGGGRSQGCDVFSATSRIIPGQTGELIEQPA